MGPVVGAQVFEGQNDMTLTSILVGFGGAVLSTMVIYFLGRWLGPKGKNTIQKSLPYMGGELYGSERVQIFMGHFQFVILFVCFEMGMCVLAFAFYLPVVPTVVIYSVFMIVMLLIITI